MLNIKILSAKELERKTFYVIFSDNILSNHYYNFAKIDIDKNDYSINCINYNFKESENCSKSIKNIKYKNKGLKTCRDILNFEKNNFTKLLQNHLYLTEGIISLNFTNILYDYGESNIYSNFFNISKELIKIDDSFEEKKLTKSFNNLFIYFINRYSINRYHVIKPDFAKQLEKEHKFYIGTWKDVKDHVINFDDIDMDKYIDIYK